MAQNMEFIYFLFDVGILKSDFGIINHYLGSYQI